MRKRRPFPRSLAECIAPAADPVLTGRGKLQARLTRDWGRIAGEAAAISLPHSLTFPKQSASEGVLTLAVPAAHAMEIQYMEPLLLERIASYLGYRAVTRIRIQQTREEQAAPLPAQDAALAEKLAALARSLQSDAT